MTDATLVLVTRTPPAGTVLAERIRGMGYDARECAPFRLEGPTDPQAVASTLRSALPADRVIFTSQEGVRQSVALVGAAAFSRSLVIVPGEGTAAAANALGLDNVVFPSRHGTSEAMLSMPELGDVDGLDVLVLAAAGGRSLMAQVLEKRGANVERIHVYRRVDQELPDGLDADIRSAGCLITLGASWEAVNGLSRELSGAARKRVLTAPLVAPSRRVAERAEVIGFVHRVTAAGADDEAMLAALERLT